MSLFSYLIQGFGFGFTAAAQPGPFLTYLISQTLRNGWRRTLIAVLAPLVSDGPIIVLVLLLLSRVPEWFRVLLQIAGGVFILYLALGAFRAWRKMRTGATDAPPASAGSQSLLRAALMNTLSPGPWLYWSLITGPILVRGLREHPTYGVAFLVGFYGAMLSSLAAIIMIFGTARRFGPRVSRAMVGISALALAGFGLYQLITGLLSLP